MVKEMITQLFVCYIILVSKNIARLFIYLFIHLSIYLFIHLFIYLFIYLFVCLYIYLFNYLLFIYLFIIYLKVGEHQIPKVMYKIGMYKVTIYTC